MAVEQNRRLMESVFAAMANGDGAFLDALSDEARWTVIGSPPWSRTYEGKQAILDDLMRLFFVSSPTATRPTPRVSWPRSTSWSPRLVDRRQRRGAKPYHQTYCYVLRRADGKVCELTEYNDTDLVKQALERPAAR